MTTFITITGGILTALFGLTVVALVVRWSVREKLADAWDYGYNIRGYDTLTGQTSPNPYTTNQYPVVDPCTLLEPCHVQRCVKHVDGMHVTAENAAISHNPFECDYCKQNADVEDIARDGMSDILIRTAAALKGEPHPLTMHDWSDLPEVAATILTAPKCEARDGDRCILTWPHAGQHRDARGRSWPNMAGFTPYESHSSELTIGQLDPEIQAAVKRSREGRGA